jgi:arginine/ornithine N-succinyltransferase beta subunit
MSSNYERISGERGKLESLLGKIPGYKGYKEKEMRREADSLVRDALVRDFTAQLNRLTPIQTNLLSTGAIEMMGDMGAVKTALQTLIDRIRFAAQGYAGFFDAVRVKEDVLDKLETFDQQLVAEIAKVSAAIDALDKAVQANTDIKPAIATARGMVQEVATLFDKRSSVISGV